MQRQFTIRATIAVMAALLVALGALSLGTSLWTTYHQRDDALIINLAGRQRMLAQELAQGAWRAPASGAAGLADVQRTAQRFKAGLDTLLNGGTLSYAGRVVDVPAAKTSAFRQALRRVQEVWGPFRNAAETVARTEPASPQGSQATAELERRSETTLTRIDEAVRSYQASAEATVSRLRVVQVGILMAGALTLAVGVGVMRRRVLGPIAALDGAIRRMRAGDLDHPIEVDVPNELGQLAEAFAAMRSQVKERLEIERRYRDLFDNVPIGLFRTAEEGTFLEANPTLVRMLGYSSRDELMAGSAADLYVNPDDRRRWRQELQHRGIVQNFEVPLRSKNGSPISAELNVRPVRGEDGEVLYFEGAVQDVTSEVVQRQRLEEVYRLGEALADCEDETRVCHEAIRHLHEGLGYDDAGILLAEDDGLRIAAHSHRHRDASLLRKTGDVIPPGDSPAFEAFRRGASLRIDDLAKPPWEMEIADKRSWVIVPLQTMEAAFGVLTLQHVQPSAFTSEDERLLTAVAGQVAVALSNVRRHDELRRTTTELVDALTESVQTRDAYTGHHSDRASALAEAVGRRLGLSSTRLERLGYAAAMHDIGKIAIPDRVLHKPGDLTDEEWQQVRRHPEVGADLVRSVERLHPVAEIIEQHQERYDGSGYPRGMADDAIALEARIIAVVDAWDAMTTDRPYRAALPREEALAELRRNAGSQFDPDVVTAFLQVQVDPQRSER